VVEDATDIILNLKQVPFKMMGEGLKIARLRVDQPGEVMSGQIETDADVEVLDRNLHIATVSEGGKLDIEMRIKSGRGYVSADRNYDEDLPIGYIPIDSVHSPVRKVNYTVEAARLGQNTDFDKLAIEVWTNGAISPQDAIGQAAKLLKDHMTIFINFEETPEVVEEPTERAANQMNEVSKSSSSASAPTIASRMPTSRPLAISSRRPKPKCCAPRISAASRSTRSRRSSPASV
jgi:DNA-directed RNA polymerase subunit alpha